MSDKPFEFVDESEEPRAQETVTHGSLTGWETVVFLVGDKDDDPTPPSGNADEGG